MFQIFCEDLLGDLWSGDLFAREGCFVAHRGTVIREDGGKVTLEMDFPGAGKGDFKVLVRGRKLLIEGEWRGRKVEKTFALAKEINERSLKAEMKEGVLRVVMERKDPPAEGEVEVPIE